MSQPFNNPTAATVSLFIHHFFNEHVDPSTLIDCPTNLGHEQPFEFDGEYLEAKTKELTRFLFKHFAIVDLED